MNRTTIDLRNHYVRIIAVLAVLQIVLTAFCDQKWWSMVVFIIVTMTQAMKPDRFLAFMWIAEVFTTLLVAIRLLTPHMTTIAFIAWSGVIVIVCVGRIFRLKARNTGEA